MVRSKDSWKTNPSEQVECVRPDGEVVVKRRCGRPGCRTPCANPEDGQPRCESCAIVGRVGANYRQKKSTLKKKCREENATLKSHLPRVVWFKDNDEWMKECKQHMEKQGIVILRNWREEGWAESLENDLKTCGYFDLRADGGAPVVPGNIQEHYLSQEELLPDTKTNELRKEMMEIVRRLSRYMFNLDHEDVQVEIAALKKGAHCPDKQVWHADDIHQRNIKGLCYISRKCTPAKILPYETLRGDPIPEEMSHYDGSQDFRQKILDRFGGVFERESVIAAAESYDSADLLHPFCEAGDLAIFYGDFPHAGWDNVVTGEDKYFYFINSSANGAVDVNFQFHVGWYCNVKGAGPQRHIGGKRKRNWSRNMSERWCPVLMLVAGPLTSSTTMPIPNRNISRKTMRLYRSKRAAQAATPKEEGSTGGLIPTLRLSTKRRQIMKFLSQKPRASSEMRRQQRAGERKELSLTSGGRD